MNKLKALKVGSFFRFSQFLANSGVARRSSAVGAYPLPEKRKSCAKARGLGPRAFWTFGCSLLPSFYSYDLVVSSDSDYIF